MIHLLSSSYPRRADPTAVNRGFATTSIASKKKQEETVEPEVSAESKSSDIVTHDSNAQPTTAGSSLTVAQAGQPTNGIKEDWEDEALAQQQALQGLVDRLYEKGEKEVSRIIKVRMVCLWQLHTY